MLCRSRLEKKLRAASCSEYQDSAKALYDDLPEEDIKSLESNIMPHSYAVQNTQMTRTPHSYILSTYVMCEKSKTVPIQYQRLFAEAASAEIFTVAAGHSPWFTKMDELFEIIKFVLDRGWMAKQLIRSMVNGSE